MIIPCEEIGQGKMLWFCDNNIENIHKGTNFILKDIVNTLLIGLNKSN
jgi:hypothetical protein